MNACRFTRIAFLLSLGSAFVAMMCSGVFASELKPAQMSFQTVIRNSAKVKVWVEEIRKIQTEGIAKVNMLTSELGKLEQELAKAQDKPEEKEKLDVEIKKKRDELRSEQEATKVKMSFKQQSMQSVIKGQVNEVVEKIAKEEGYTMVMSSEAIYYSKDVPDITDRVTKALDTLPTPQQQIK